MFPIDWEDIDEIQSYEDSIRETSPDDLGPDIMFWETHLGVCPECQVRRARGETPAAGCRLVKPMSVL
jgi:hypothetical protein